MIGPTAFHMLGVPRDLADTGWDDPTVPLLWRYNLHYFEDLCARDAPERRRWHAALLDRWIVENRPGHGTGWSPYPTSLRIVNWTKGLSSPDAPLSREAAWVHSLAMQARWLRGHLEWHLLGNHLFANAKALVFAGLFFDGTEAAQWLRTGQRILLRELPEQILPDGGHFERSPMYHALAVEDALDLVNVLQVYDLSQANALREALAGRIPAMLRWLRVMTRPDGSMARFNDCADGIAPSVAELIRYAEALGFRADPGDGVHGAASCIRLEPSGYIRLGGTGSQAWLDVAPVGPDYLPGHAHADTLSFELVAGGQPLVVNRGTSVYAVGDRRHVERSTAAHSTVTVAGEDSSEVWAAFRVGRRARVERVAVEASRTGVRVRAEHDGYTHLPGAPRHRRTWEWQADGGLQVTDRVVAGRRFAPWAVNCPASVARFHLAPGLLLVRRSATAWDVSDGDTVVATARVDEGDAFQEVWEHAQGFGELREAVTLAVTLSPTTWQSRVCWTWEAP